MRFVGLVGFVAACGRIGFEELPDPDPDASVDAAVTVCSASPCLPPYISKPTGCFRLVTIAARWLEAERACEADGGHLVVEDSVNEHFDVHDIATGIPQIWVGWTDRRGPDNVFTWVVPDQGGLLQSNNCVFDNGEPTAGDNDHCVAQNGTNGCPDYADLDCELPLPYVCECDGVRADPQRY